MPRGVKNTSNKCFDHMLVLKPLLKQCYFPDTITCSFCNHDKTKKKSNPSKNSQASLLSHPIYNKDDNFATPTFILSVQKNYYEEHGLKLKNEHEKKIKDYSDQKQEMLVPKPRSRHNYCGTCRDHYQDYLQHIVSSKHKKRIKESRFNKYILQTVQLVKKQFKIDDKHSPQTLQQEQQIEFISRPRKRVKMDPVFENRNVFQNNLPLNSIPPPPPIVNPFFYNQMYGMNSINSGMNNNFLLQNLIALQNFNYMNNPYLQMMVPQIPICDYNNIQQFPVFQQRNQMMKQQNVIIIDGNS